MSQETKYQDWSLRLAVALPVLLIVFVAGAIYLPRFWAKPAQYDFVYTKQSTGNEAYSVSRENNSLVKEENPSGIAPEDLTKGNAVLVEPKLYRYHVATGESDRISFDEAATLRYQNRVQSQDGYEVTTGGYGGGLFFGSSSKPAIYLRSHGASTKITLTGIDTYNLYNFQFIGWVEK
jgi:hypothetical protein